MAAVSQPYIHRQQVSMQSHPGLSSHHQHHMQQQPYPGHSIMEDVSDSEHDEDEEDDEEDDEGSYEEDDITMTTAAANMDQDHFYREQQKQATFYQQHQARYGESTENVAGIQQQQQLHQQQQQQQQQQNMDPNGHSQNGAQVLRSAGAGVDGQDGLEDEDMYSDDESSTASIPDENIDFSLTYALHTFLATVEGQASVVKGDSLLLLDDANSYWWLVRVLKTEDVGYIPAENIETPYERLARLNKHRNVDLAAATIQEKQAGAVQDREKLKGLIAGKAKGMRFQNSGEGGNNGNDSKGRRVFFGAPTYIDHPGKTWSSDEEDDEEEDDDDGEEDEGEEGGGHRSMEEDETEEQLARRNRDDVVSDRIVGQEIQNVDDSLVSDSGLDMEPDDGVEWADSAAREHQNRVMDQKAAPVLGNPIAPKSNNPFAQKRPEVNGTQPSNASTQQQQPQQQPQQDLSRIPSNETRRITATPQVAQSTTLLPSAIVQQQNRNVSNQSVNSTASGASTGSVYSNNPSSPEDPKNKKGGAKIKKGSKEDLSDGGEKKKRGMLGGLFSRNKKSEKKGISSSDVRTSEDSLASGAAESSPGSRMSEESGHTVRSTLSNNQKPNGPGSPQAAVSAHGLRLQQMDLATHQAYATKYLPQSSSGNLNSPLASEAAAAVAQSAAAMRLVAMNAGGQPRPSSIIVSPNPAGPPLLNVIRIFAGEHIKSEASFKTVLLNETTSSTDLIRQAMQRFRLHGASTPGSDKNFFLTVKDVNGEEMELNPGEKPLLAFQEAVQRWSDDDNTASARLGAITPTVKRSSISSISSIVSLSSHPAIAKLGMNDFSDDSAVKIYIHRRRPGSGIGIGMPDSNSEFSSYSTSLSTVQESSPERVNGENQHQNGPNGLGPRDRDITPNANRYNPSLSVDVNNNNGAASSERFTSPAAKFTIQLLIHPADLPENSIFDPSSDAIITKSILRDRQSAGHPMIQTYPPDNRKRFLLLPRNVTVMEVVEQGLEKFGIQEGVVDGGDEIEDRAGKRRSMVRVRYCLTAATPEEERRLFPSSKLLDAYSTPPTLKPAEKMTMEQKRRSREFSGNSGSLGDILPTDPVFILRRVNPNPRGGPTRLTAASSEQNPGALQRQQAQPSTASQDAKGPTGAAAAALSPREIIAAQRAASRANQTAIITAHSNTSQGVDVVMPDRGTLRSSRLLEPSGGEVVRYSYIDGDGETYDISELLEEEWGRDGSKASPNILQPPTLHRMGTDASNYVTAPSTPEPTNVVPEITSGSSRNGDILRTVVDRAASQPEGKLEEKISRVIAKVKSTNQNPSQPSVSINGTYSPRAIVVDSPASQTSSQMPSSTRSSLYAPSVAPSSGRQTPTMRNLTPVQEGIPAEPSTASRSESRQASYHQTAVTVNRIVSRHRQQPSIASIMSDLSTPTKDDERDRSDRSDTPMTATSSSHPTPPLRGGPIFTRAVSTASPIPRNPVKYQDDFGMKTLMGIIAARASNGTPSRRSSTKRRSTEIDPVQKMFWGEKVSEAEIVHPDIKACFEGIQGRLDAFDSEIDELLGMLVLDK